jgi:hypothetical protein
MPVVLDKCATPACHGTDGRGGWRIYGDRNPSTNLLYTNYIIMHEYTLGNDRLINRDFPDQSLLLTDGLPEATDHPVPIDPAFRGRNDRKYLAILEWIESLSVPAPNYGISLSPQGQNP